MIERVVFMELTELLDQLKVLFGVENTKELTNKLKTVSVNNQFEYHQKFTDIVSDLKIDWLQKVYQYYEADREEKKTRLYTQINRCFIIQITGEM